MTYVSLGPGAIAEEAAHDIVRAGFEGQNYFRPSKSRTGTQMPKELIDSGTLPPGSLCGPFSFMPTTNFP